VWFISCVNHLLNKFYQLLNPKHLNTQKFVVLAVNLSLTYRFCLSLLFTFWFSAIQAQCNFLVNVSNDPLFCIGSLTTATITPQFGSLGTPPYTYTWSPPVSTSSVASGLGPGTYNINVKDANGCTAFTQLIIISANNPAINFTPKDVSCFGANNGSITASISNGNFPPYTYTWVAQGINTNTINNLSPGNYTLNVTDNTGCQFTNTVSITQPTNYTASVNSPSINCPNGTSSATVNVSGSTPPYTYSTTPGGLSTAIMNSLTANSYTTVIKDANSCTVTVINNLIQPTTFGNVFTLNPETCDGSKNGSIIANVSGGSGSYTYSWSVTPAQITATLNNAGAGNYTLYVVDSKNCTTTFTTNLGLLNNFGVNIVSTKSISCFGACNGSITAQHSGGIAPYSYQWQGPSTSTLPAITNLCAGSYTIGVTDQTGCTTYKQIVLTDPPAIAASVNGASVTCVSNSVALTATIGGGTPPYNYSWNVPAGNLASIIVTPTATTVYSVGITDNSGCTTFASQTVQVRPALSVTVPVNNTGLCLGAELTINPIVGGGDGNYSYQWLPTGVTTPTINVKNLTVSNFTFIVRDGCNTPPAVRIITLTIFPKTKVNFNVSDRIGCEPFCIQLNNATPKSSEPIWTFGDSPNQQSGNLAAYCYKTNGIFDLSLQLTDSNGCEQKLTEKQYITVLKKPLADFNFSNPNPTFYEPEVSISNTTDDALNYEWWFKNKLFSKSKEFNYVFQDTGCYTFTLKAINFRGCSDSISKTICVTNGFNFYIPSFFTPDDDNLNEIFKPKGTGWKTGNYSFQVYSRWGFPVFKTSDILEGWDGKYKSNYVAPDTYIWRILVTDERDVEHEYKGTITVLR
jgi:gliding motility-associated-like protein